MRNNVFIRTFFGIILLAAFALSNTPTKVLHLLFANHVDTIEHNQPDGGLPQLATAGIDCHCHSNVVISPYVLDNETVTTTISYYYQEYNKELSKEPIPVQTIPFGLRGPPILMA